MEYGVAVVDDHPVVRDGLCGLIDSMPEFNVVDRAGSIAECRDILATTEATLWILDVCLPDGSGVDLCRKIKELRPDDRCLMLTSEDDETVLRDAVVAGASGFLLKRASSLALGDALKVLASGGSALDPSMVAAVFGSLREVKEQAGPDLSEQELVVLAHLGEGRSNREIAEAMFLSEKTIRNYVSRLLSKLEVDNRTQAALYASTYEGLPSV